MAGSVNKVILIGNLGQDPEVRTFQNGNRVAALSVATSETWKDKATGEKKERTEWHRVQIFAEALIEIAEKYLKKGSKVYLEGQLETRKWQDQAGNDRYATEVVLRAYRSAITLLDKKEGGYQPPGEDDYSRGPTDGKTAQQRADDFQGPGGRRGFSDDLGDEIPFAPEWR